jgi:hypothetical protein
MELLEVMDVLNNAKIKSFMKTILGGKRSGPGAWHVSPSWHEPGDCASRHADFIKLQSTAFPWNASKDWNLSWGRAFHWSPRGTQRTDVTIASSFSAHTFLASHAGQACD